jgi:hypothetical protein
MVRDNVLLTRELNDLRKEGSSLMNERRIIDKAVKDGKLNSATGVQELLAALGIQLRQARNAPRTPVEETASSRGSTMNASRRTSVNLKDFPAVSNDVFSKSSSRDMKHIKRSTALRRTSASGKVQTMMMKVTSTEDGVMITGSKDNYEAWCTIQSQQRKIRELETSLESLCLSLDMDAIDILTHIDQQLEETVR